jgi:hypothetical protein
MAAKKHILNTIARLAKAEEQFLAARFLAPVIAGNKTQVRIAGVRCQMAVRPADFGGWGIFRPISHAQAQLERPATLKERCRYAQLLPMTGLILLERLRNASWLALPAQPHDGLVVDGLALLNLVEDADRFDTVRACFDGQRFWSVDLDPRHDPAASEYLRKSLAIMRSPRQLDRPGLTPEQRIAYALVHERAIAKEMADARRTSEGRVRTALEHAGAALRSFVEKDGALRVTFTVDGQRHTSIVSADNLGVWSAGVCLSGQDSQFDLASLVSVLREGHSRGGIRHGLHV